MNSVGGPVLGLVSLTGVTCNDPSSGSINVSTSGGTPHYEWLWSPGGQATPKIENLAVGVYEVMVTDETGCTGFNVFEIKEVPPERNDICFVTVDSATQMNMVEWENSDPDNASHYNIYREGSEKDNYQLIGSVPATELSIFTDSVADPTLRSWRYKLSVVDHCGNESELSDHHKTIHLTMNTGWISNTVNLLWDHYEGFDVQTYKLYREIAAAPGPCNLLLR